MTISIAVFPIQSNQYGAYVGLSLSIRASANVQQYYGPVSPELVWLRMSIVATNQPLTADASIVDRSDRAAEDWFAQPGALGAGLARAEMLRAQPGKWLGNGLGTSLCTYCREGDAIYPVFSVRWEAAPRLLGGPYLADASMTHLYRKAWSSRWVS